MLIDTIRRVLESVGLFRREARAPGRFLDRSYSDGAGKMSYKLYIPARTRGGRTSLLVMLHGCRQTPEDFATGTRMNDLADEHRFLVVYPAQSAAANLFTCWNWFRGEDQERESGEPALIAGITREVALEHAVDATRTYIAGLSAGGAMAVVLGATYPDLFSAVGVHSGVPYRAAHDAASAMAAMRGSTPRLDSTGVTHATPTIVFHGDRDTTVDVDNGSAIVDQAVSNAERDLGPLRKAIREGISSEGRPYTTTTYRTSRTASFIEYWVLHGAGHAWSGGFSKGTYTDESGPDASAEMVRFFLGRRTRRRPPVPRSLSEYFA
jgi:poly(hydroxyalkanoate) depolymerase family esterase